MRDINFSCDNSIEARRFDPKLENKKKNSCSMIDVDIPAGATLHYKVIEKIKNYQDLKKYSGRICGIRKIWVILFVNGALESVTKDLEKWFAKLDIHVSVAFIQKTNC